MKADGWIDFKPDQAFAPAQCDAFTLVNGVPKVDFIFPIMDVSYVVIASQTILEWYFD